MRDELTCRIDFHGVTGDAFNFDASEGGVVVQRERDGAAVRLDIPETLRYYSHGIDATQTELAVVAYDDVGAVYVLEYQIENPMDPVFLGIAKEDAELELIDDDDDY